MTEPSAAYWEALEAAKLHHASAKTYHGSLVRVHAERIRQIIVATGSRSALDYGCGKGRQYDEPLPNGQYLTELWGVPVRMYDPAVPAFAKEPTRPRDLVICTHTLGSIPVADLRAWALDRIYGLAGRAIYIAEKLGPVRKRVVPRPELHPIGWTIPQWLDLLDRPSADGRLLRVCFRDPDLMALRDFTREAQGRWREDRL